MAADQHNLLSTKYELLVSRQTLERGILYQITDLLNPYTEQILEIKGSLQEVSKIVEGAM